MTDHPSASSAQQAAEVELVQGVAEDLGVSLSSATLSLADGVTVEFDGYSETDRVLCEAFARVGSLKAGQKRKLTADVLKLVLAGRLLGGAWRKIIVVSSSAAQSWLLGRSWQALAVREFGIEVSCIELASETRSAG